MQYMFECVCVCVCVYVCMYVCMCRYICVYVRKCVYVGMCIHAYAYIYIYIYIYIWRIVVLFFMYNSLLVDGHFEISNESCRNYSTINTIPIWIIAYRQRDYAEVTTWKQSRFIGILAVNGFNDGNTLLHPQRCVTWSWGKRGRLDWSVQELEIGRRLSSEGARIITLFLYFLLGK